MEQAQKAKEEAKKREEGALQKAKEEEARLKAIEEARIKAQEEAKRVAAAKAERERAIAAGEIPPDEPEGKNQEEKTSLYIY